MKSFKFPSFSINFVRKSTIRRRLIEAGMRRKLGLSLDGGMHETSALAWCTGKTQRNRVEREVGGGIRMGNTCNSMADSCQCMTKPTEML